MGHCATTTDWTKTTCIQQRATILVGLAFAPKGCSDRMTSAHGDYFILQRSIHLIVLRQRKHFDAPNRSIGKLFFRRPRFGIKAKYFCKKNRRDKQKPARTERKSTEERNETRETSHIHSDMYHFCHNVIPAYPALWRNVGRTVDKNINQEESMEKVTQ